MNDQPRGRRPILRDRINLESPRDVFRWTAMWGLTDQELRDAVAAAGPMAADVAAYLERGAEDCGESGIDASDA